ncbi:hypothetical protein NVP1259O_32 [Vibrio phage 1.259.O._10N.286.48.F4]|nr:hypothetical protein NVP1259O_32 [Vibrio phage 1.259.O._10N.286.48.F4]
MSNQKQGNELLAMLPNYQEAPKIREYLSEVRIKANTIIFIGSPFKQN